MSDEPQQPAAEWLTYQQAAKRLGLRTPNAAAARARRGRWPKRIRNTDNAAEILVPGELLATPRPNLPVQGREVPAPTSDTPTIADAVRAAVAPLQALLDREVQDRRALQVQADALRDQLATVQLEAAKATGAASTEQAKREAAEARAADLQRQLEESKRRRWWWWR